MVNKNKLIQNINEFTEKPLYFAQKTALLKKHGPNVFGKVAVLLGGRSSERQISLESGQACLQALQRMNVDAHIIDPNDNFVNELNSGNFDRAFVMLHGKEGEDGVIQGILEMMGIPYTGSKVAASALAMDKLRAKLVMHGLEIPTPIFGVAHTLSQAQALAMQIGIPLSVKPVNEGSSLGVTRVDDLEKLANAYARAAIYGEVMIEKWIDGEDYFVSILGEEVLPPVRVKPANQFYDFNSKYESNKTQYLCPAPLSKEKENELKNISYSAFRALGCEGWGRIDLVQDHAGQFWVLEVNTIPGMTSHSLVPMSAKAKGMSFDELVMAILATSINEKQMSVGKLAQL